MSMARRLGLCGAALAMALVFGGWATGPSQAAAADFTLDQALSYPFVSELVSAPKADRIAWVRLVKGVRNIWAADGPAYLPRQVTSFTADDGQELTQLTFSPDGTRLVFVRGGDHDANWPAKGGLQPNSTSGTLEPKVEIWSADPIGAAPAKKIGEGDAPAISAQGKLVFLRDGAVFTVKSEGAEPTKLFFDRGKDGRLAWSPDGSKLAFVSNRDDHAFIGVWSGEDAPLTWLAPSTGTDGSPIWSPSGAKIAFTRQPGEGGPPSPLLVNTPQPWSIWVADPVTGAGRLVWKSAETLRASYPDVAGEANLHWAGEDKITFLSMADNWPHLYSQSLLGGLPKLLTPGAFMVEHVTAGKDGKSLIYSANTGAIADDDARRHLYRIPVDARAPSPLTSGESLEWSPVSLSDSVAYITADARRPPAVEVVTLATGKRHRLDLQAPDKDFPEAHFVTPRQVTFKAPDGLLIHGQLFQTGGGNKPGVIFVHGGPPRQMMLGWSYMRYYSNAYAMNQYLAAHGFTVLSVNYRLGIGYGYDFQHPAKGGWAGSSEYQDVLAGAKYLQTRGGVDPSRIGIWGGSYGGYLTAMALARNSDVFKAGVDLHGVHDWSRTLAEEMGPPLGRYEQGDRIDAMATAFKASPVADVDRWTSPVLMIHGDDDRNVRVNQTIDLARRLRDRNVPYEELIIPDDIHDFLRYENWRKADAATAEFLTRKLGVK